MSSLSDARSMVLVEHGRLVTIQTHPGCVLLPRTETFSNGLAPFRYLAPTGHRTYCIPVVGCDLQLTTMQTLGHHRLQQSSPPRSHCRCVLTTKGTKCHAQLRSCIENTIFLQKMPRSWSFDAHPLSIKRSDIKHTSNANPWNKVIHRQ